MLSSVSKLLVKLEEKEIRYCHWKSNEHIEEALNGDTDLDLLFDPSQRSILESVFYECGLKRFRSTYLMQYNAIEDYIGFDQETAKIWHVHTHYRLTLGEKHLKGYTINSWGEQLLENREKTNNIVWTANPADEYVILLCRIALKLRWRDYWRRLGQDDIKEITWLSERINLESVESSASKMLGEKSQQYLCNLYGSQTYKKSQFYGLQHSLRKELKNYTSYNCISSWAIRTKREIFWLIGAVKRKVGINNFSANRRVSPSGGIVVSILGCDGAGKSTTLDYITKEYNKKIDVVSIYFGSGDGKSSLIRKPMKYVAKKVGGKGLGHSVEKDYSENKKKSLKSRLYFLAKVVWAITLAKEKKSKQKQMIKARNNGMLVITDRYPQSDYPGAGDGPLLYNYRDRSRILNRLANWEYHIYKDFSCNPPD